MMVQALLCESSRVARTVTAAADVLGGVGRDYAHGPQCSNRNAVAFLKIHGMTDPFITYDTVRNRQVHGLNTWAWFRLKCSTSTWCLLRTKPWCGYAHAAWEQPACARSCSLALMHIQLPCFMSACFPYLLLHLPLSFAD